MNVEATPFVRSLQYVLQTDSAQFWSESMVHFFCWNNQMLMRYTVTMNGCKWLWNSAIYKSQVNGVFSRACELNICHVNTHRTMWQPPRANTLSNWQLDFMVSWGLLDTRMLAPIKNNWKYDPSVHTTCSQSSRGKLATSQSHVGNILVVLLLQYAMESKERSNGLPDMCLLFSALNVNVISVSVSWLLQTVL